MVRVRPPVFSDPASSGGAGDGSATTPPGICREHGENLWSRELDDGVLKWHSNKEGTGTAEMPKLKIFIK